MKRILFLVISAAMAGWSLRLMSQLGTALLANVMMNLYPIVLQRWHRARLAPLLRRRNSESISPSQLFH